jgi:uncharacterized protein YbbC (DUF1343 family)
MSVAPSRRPPLIRLLILTTGCAVVAPGLAAAPPKLPRSSPEAVGMNPGLLGRIDDVVAEGLANGQMPGCVVLVGHRGKIVFFKAYGHRQIEPSKVAMTEDTVFDLASLTKPIATATSVMLLVERGRLRLRNRVAQYLPEFGQNGKGRVRVEQLLTHEAGFVPDNKLEDYDDGPEKAFDRIFALEPRTEPGTQFVYSDVGYIVAAELVRRITGQNVHEFSQQKLFQPLGMQETGFLPNESLRSRAATTQERDGRWMQGEVHDPRAYRLGGIAGHAGLFSTADDLAVYAQMMIGKGSFGGIRVLGEQTVATMVEPREVSRGLRALGWDIRSGYSSNRGELFSSRAFGHGGFTGTAMWVDPELDLFVIFLSNRVHPDGKGSVNSLAGRIGTIAAAAIDSNLDGVAGSKRSVAPIASSSNEPSPQVLTGIDVLERDGCRLLAGRRVGLITNHTGLASDGTATGKLLADAPDVELVALFSPEHGIAGKLDVSRIADGRDEPTGLPIYSLYGENRAPTPESLRGIDTLVFDIQDIGTRYYTYISTMAGAMKAAAEHGLRFVVLDRPNPIGGVDVEGPVLDAGRESFVGSHPIPVRHGMTIGELAGMFNAELELGVDLHVVPVEGWRRADWFDQTGLLWVNPSPNMRSLTQALLYPGVGLLETTNLSVGRGTDTPFEVIGAPWLDGRRLAGELNSAGLHGVRFVPVRFTPESSQFRGEGCGGVNLIVTDRSAFRPVRTGLEIARQLRRLYPDTWDAASYGRLLANEQTLAGVLAGETVTAIEAGYQPRLNEFLARRAAFLLYE